MQATARHGSNVLSHVSSERISVRAPWEGALSAQLVSAVIPPAVLVLRLTMGWIFVWAGFDKLIRGFSAAGFLEHARGPLSGWFHSLAANSAALDVIEPMVIWGQILIGICLIFGVLTRWAALWGAVQMFLFYLAQFPPEHNPFMEYYLVYILALGLLGALGAGRLFGLDAYVERLSVVRRAPGATLVLG